MHEVKVSFALCQRSEDGLLSINVEGTLQADQVNIVSLTDDTSALKTLAKDVCSTSYCSYSCLYSRLY